VIADGSTSGCRNPSSAVLAPHAGTSSGVARTPLLGEGTRGAGSARCAKVWTRLAPRLIASLLAPGVARLWFAPVSGSLDKPLRKRARGPPGERRLSGVSDVRLRPERVSGNARALKDLAEPEGSLEFGRLVGERPSPA